MYLKNKKEIDRKFSLSAFLFWILLKLTLRHTMNNGKFPLYLSVHTYARRSNPVVLGSSSLANDQNDTNQSTRSQRRGAGPYRGIHGREWGHAGRDRRGPCPCCAAPAGGAGNARDNVYTVLADAFIMLPLAGAGNAYATYTWFRGCLYHAPAGGSWLAKQD